MNKIEYHFTARLKDNSNNVIATESKALKEQRSNLRDIQVQKWLDKTVKTNGNSVTAIEVEHKIGDGEFGYDLWKVDGGKTLFLADATAADPRNIALAKAREREIKARDAAEMAKLLEPFNPDDKWIATGFAWDASHNLVKFTGERNRDRKMFRVQPMRKTHRDYYAAAGKPVWVPQENIVTIDPMRRVTEVGVLPSKSMYPYFNRIDNELPGEL